ncbi:MAG: biotin--[acetyl-CoA-carboxylase] ligase [Treponema sp.]|nr:biotin--[acetyl-CoA-carboxylase] ligase [Treponema sp.]
MNLTESTAQDFNTDSFFKYFEEESNGQIQLEREKVFFAQTVDSTNTRLKSLLQETVLDKNKSLKSLHKTLLASDTQTSGYGRLMRSFYSPKDNGIYFSFIYLPDESSFNPAFYTVSCAVAVSLALEELLGIKPQIKWVNDIYVGDRKVCGILSEGFCSPGADRVQAMVVGIGINLRTDILDLPEEIKDRAGGVLDSLGTINFSRARLLARIIFKCMSFLDGGSQSWKHVVEEYKKRSYLDGKTVTVTPIVGEKTNSYQAKVIGINDEAELEVECTDGSIKKLSTGEVTLHEN